MKLKRIFILILTFIFIFSGCKVNAPKAEEIPKETSSKDISLNIVTTNKLIYYMVQDIVEDRHNIDYMFTTKDRMWSFNYSDDSLKNISKKDIFFYFGTGIEPWSSDFIEKLNKDKVSPISLSRGIKLIPYVREIKYKESTIKDNPYFWMDAGDYKISLLNIKNSIQDKDSKNRDIYEKNFSEAIKKVEDYEKKFKEVAQKLKNYTFIVDGDELDYFTQKYGLKTLKIYNYGLILTPEDKDKIKETENKIENPDKTIFLYDIKEKLTSDEPLIKEYNLKTCNVMAYENDMRYIDILEYNLRHLEDLVNND